MLVSPFTVIAQIVNFLILVALLKRFLYKPIITAMEKREREIARRLEQAAIEAKEAQARAELYRQKQQELQQQKEAWLTAAKQEVEIKKQQLKKQAETEVNEARSQWYQILAREQAKFIRDLRQKMGQQITATTRKVLTDLANANLEEQIVITFIDRLNNLKDPDLKLIQTAIKSNPNPTVTISSTFPIAADKSSQLITLLKKQISADLEVSFEIINSDILGGIELDSSGYQISWNLETYLVTLETEILKALANNNSLVA